METENDMTSVIFRPLRAYEGYWKLVLVHGVIHIALANDSEELRNRYIKAIKKEKLRDSKNRYEGTLKFSWVGAKLIVRLVR